MNMKYNIDLVFCIDNASYLNSRDLNHIKGLVKSFPLMMNDFLTKIGTTDYYPITIRTKIITFTNYKVRHNEAILTRGFFEPLKQPTEYAQMIDSIQIVDTDQELNCDGLEAFAYGIHTNWTARDQSIKCRHILCIISGRVTNGLGDNSDYRGYPEYMPKSFTTLQSWWDDNIDINVKRLLLLTPDKSWWRHIAETWDNLLLLPYDYYQELMRNEKKMDEMIDHIMGYFFVL